MRSIVVKQKNIIALDRAEAEQEVLKCIAAVITNRRKAVADLLVQTGSPEDVKKLDFKAFNAAVMNRLSEEGVKGDKFRGAMVKLIVQVCGRNLLADGFFRQEETAGLTGVYSPPSIPTAEQFEAMQEHYESQDTTGGSSQNWGEILSGSAAVLDSLGGIIGNFTGRPQQTAGQNDLNQYGQYYGYDPNKSDGSSTTKIILWVLGIAAVAGLSYWLWKRSKSS